MSNYLVSARKYRPRKFEEVVGQKHITTTLHNAILNNESDMLIFFVDQEALGKPYVQESLRIQSIIMKMLNIIFLN